MESSKNHNHVHVHDHVCEHDHVHEHHEHEFNGISISRHETALIGSVKATIPTADYDLAEHCLSACMRDIADRVCNAGGLIGHIKFFLTCEGKSCQISVTDDEENIHRFQRQHSIVEGVAIVFAIEDDVLKKILEDTILKMFADSWSVRTLP